MIEKFNLSAELAKNFGLDLEEAYNTMIVNHHKTAGS